MLISKQQSHLRPLSCPHCGASSVFVSYDRKRLGCWQGHRYPAAGVGVEKETTDG